MKLPSSKELGSVRYHQQRLHGTGLAPSAVAFESPPTTPKKVPPTPNNTPVSSPITSAFSSPATLVGDSVKKVKKDKKLSKMAKQNGTRAEKRHLVRWNDAMDKKLLLTLQYSCSLAGLAVPWDNIGGVMGEGITGGAVIQHLAKLRIRMVEQGLPVPPPLRRGGGNGRISTSASSRTKAKATPPKNGKANKAASKKTKAESKKADPGSDDSEEEGDGWINDDSDAEYGERPAKRAKPNTRGFGTRQTKHDDTDDEVITPSKPSKRKFHNSKPSPSQSYDGVEVKTEYTAAGANWLRLEDDEANQPKTGKKTVNKKPSLKITLPVTYEDFGDDTGGVIDDENEDGMVGDGIGAFADSSYDFGEEANEEISTSPYDEAGIDEAPSASNNVGMYDDIYGTSPFNMPFSGAFTGTSNNKHYNSTSYDGGDSGLGQTSNTFHNQSEISFPQYDGEFAGVFNNGPVQAGSFGNAGYSNGNNGPDNHVGNGYGASFNAINASVNSPLGSKMHNNNQNVPFPIQTSWPNTHNMTGLSNKTSLNPTPADTSAGVDVGGGFFNDNSLLASNMFDDGVGGYSFNDGTDVLFGAGHYDGNQVGGSFFGSNPYGN